MFLQEYHLLGMIALQEMIFVNLEDPHPETADLHTEEVVIEEITDLTEVGHDQAEGLQDMMAVTEVVAEVTSEVDVVVMKTEELNSEGTTMATTSDAKTQEMTTEGINLQANRGTIDLS